MGSLDQSRGQERINIADGATLIGDRYSLEERLGSGGMAEVHGGVDRRLGRHVAVKTLRPEVAADPTIRARFEAEARAAAVLSHPNIVSIYDVGDDNGVPYLVMERLPGRSLADAIRAGRLDSEWIRLIGIDLLDGLAHAHAGGLVHRDIKPGNILLTEDDRAKLADFGIAKAVPGADHPIASMDLTMTGQVLGTPAYLAPERVQGEPATPKSDIYSVGVVLYEALAGGKPFVGATPLATVAAIERADHRPLVDARPGLPGDLAAAVEVAMDRDPGRRFANAGEMRLALTTGRGPSPTISMPAEPTPTPTVSLSGTTVEAVTPMPGSRGRNARLVALLLGLLLAFGALVWFLVSGIGGSAGRGPSATVPTTTATSTTSAPVTSPPTTASPPTTTSPAPPPTRPAPKPKPGHHERD